MDVIFMGLGAFAVAVMVYLSWLVLTKLNLMQEAHKEQCITLMQALDGLNKLSNSRLDEALSRIRTLQELIKEMQEPSAVRALPIPPEVNALPEKGPLAGHEVVAAAEKTVAAAEKTLETAKLK